MILGYYAGSEVQIEAIQLLIGGEFTIMFVGFVLILGLIIPLIIQTLDVLGYRIPYFIVASLIIAGGVIFRFVMVDAGQLTRYLYLCRAISPEGYQRQPIMIQCYLTRIFQY